MLTFTLAAYEDSDLPSETVTMEHSLVSLSKWESIHEKAFFKQDEKTDAEMMSYLEQMVIGDVPEKFEERLTLPNVEAIMAYMNKNHTATWFREDPPGRPSNETMTSELIYYWLVMYRIPFEVQHWHLGRLMTLIRICSIKQTPPKKMSRQAQMAEYKRLNDQRRQLLGTTG